MNTRIQQYFEAFEARLIESFAVTSYEIIRRDLGSTDGKIRIKTYFSDNSYAEFFEYVIERGGVVLPQKYSFHWQDDAGNLKRRWDNAPHFPQFTLSDHIHYEDGSVQQANECMSLPAVLEIIEQSLHTSV